MIETSNQPYLDERTGPSAAAAVVCRTPPYGLMTGRTESASASL